MKRDWKIIRQILLTKESDPAAEPVDFEHALLCVEAGFIEGHREPEDIGFKLICGRLTALGCEWVNLLRSEPCLAFALARLDALKIGSSSDVLKALLVKEQAALAGKEKTR